MGLGLAQINEVNSRKTVTAQPVDAAPI